MDDFNAFMRDLSKEVVETILDGELTDHLDYEKRGQKTKTTENARKGLGYGMLSNNDLLWRPFGGTCLNAEKGFTQNI